MSTIDPAPGQQVRSAAQRASDPLGWAIAASPLLPLAVTVPLALANVMPSFSVEQILALAITSVLVVGDKRRLLAADPALGGRLPATAWFLLPPVYLWKRAAALKLGRRQFWANLGAYAVAIVLAIVLTIAAAASQLTARQAPAPARTPAVAQAPAPAQLAAPAALPACDDRAVADTALRLVSDMAPAREAGVTAIHLSDQREVAQGSGRAGPYRACTGQMLTSDDEEVAVDYRVELRGDDVLVHVQVRAGQ